MHCAKAAEPIEMPLGGGLIHVAPRNHVLDGDQDRTNPFATARGDKSTMRPFAELFWTLVDIGSHLLFESVTLFRFCRHIVLFYVAGVSSVFTKTGCDRTAIDEMLGSKEGVTDQNLLQYLGIIEARANQLLLTRAFIIKHQVGTSAARALALLSKTVQRKILCWTKAPVGSPLIHQEALSYYRGTARRAVLVNSCYVSRAIGVMKVSNSKSDFQGHSRALTMVSFDRPHTISYQFSIATMSLSCTGCG